jgi:iron complex outermembrane recepter protein
MQETFIRCYPLLLLIRSCSIAATFNLLFCVPVFAMHMAAQTEPASISGRVLDQAGAVVRDARVRLKQTASRFERTAATDENGAFHFDGVQPGPFRLDVTAMGFSVTAQDLELTAGERRELNIRLQPVAVNGSMTVVAEAGYYPVTLISGAKTDLPLRDLPQAIAVVPRRVLVDQQAIRLDEAVRNASGVYRDNTFAGALDRFNIRGFITTDFLRDGFRESQGEIRETAEIEQVEVLKGPASILYGRLEPGGVINVVPKKPLTEPIIAAELQAGSFQFYRTRFDLSSPLKSDRSLLFRINGVYQTEDGFREPTDVTVQRYLIAPRVAWNIRSASSLALEATFLRDKRPFDRGLVAIGDRVADLPRERFLGEPGDYALQEHYGLGYRFEHSFAEHIKLRNGFRIVFNDSEDYRAERAGRINAATGTLPRRFTSNDDDGRNFTSQTDLTGRFETGPLGHHLLAGFDFTRDNNGGINGFNPSLVPINIYQPVYGALVLPLTTLVRNDDRTTDAVGFFVQDQVRLAEPLKLLVGARHDSVRSETRDFLSNTFNEQKNGAFTPRAGLVYQPAQTVSIFASYSRGFNPVTGARMFDGSLLDPTTGKQYEAGLKTEWLKSSLTANLTWFHIAKENVLTTDPDHPGFVLQTGEVRSRGMEFDLLGQVTPGWSVIAAYSYIDAVVTRDNVVPVGNRLISVPKHGGSIWTSYEVLRGTWRGLGLGAGLFYVGERRGDLANSFSLPSYLRADASVFYKRSRWKLSINFKNLTNKRYFEAGTNWDRIDVGIPFTVLGALSIDFR